MPTNFYYPQGICLQYVISPPRPSMRFFHSLRALLFRWNSKMRGWMSNNFRKPDSDKLT